MKRILDNKLWATVQWGEAPLGDNRRNKRATIMASRMLEKPAASLPNQMIDWKHIKGAYRFLQSGNTTHEALQTVHWDNVAELASQSTKTVLFIQDKSEIDYSNKKQTNGLGPIGNHFGKGILVQSILAVEYDSKPLQIIGLANQKAWIRTERSYRKKESRSQRLKRTTEADYWIANLEKIARPKDLQAQWVALGDRENDMYKFIRFCKESKWNFLVRAKGERVIITVDGENLKLADWVRTLPVRAAKTIALRARPKQPARVASLSISWGTMFIKTPKNGFPKSTHETIKVSCIRAWEDSLEGLEWFLITNLTVENEESVLEKLSWYESRWLIEEYHKCLKTGCALEERQLKSAHGLLALLGFLGVIATRLLAIKIIAKQQPSEKAIKYYPIMYLQILAYRLDVPIEEMTCQQYWHNIARLGEFIGRKSDGEPGWQTLWKGWLKFQELIEGAELWKKCG